MTLNIFNLCLTFCNTRISTLNKQPGTKMGSINVSYYYQVNHWNSLNVAHYKACFICTVKFQHASESPGVPLKTQDAGPNSQEFWLSWSGVQPENLYFYMSSQVILLSEKHTFRTTSIRYRFKRKEYCDQLHGGMEVGFQQFLGSSVLHTGWQHQIIWEK